jgi:hypothetical protein
MGQETPKPTPRPIVDIENSPERSALAAVAVLADGPMMECRNVEDLLCARGDRRGVPAVKASRAMIDDALREAEFELSGLAD